MSDYEEFTAAASLQYSTPDGGLAYIPPKDDTSANKNHHADLVQGIRQISETSDSDLLDSTLRESLPNSCKRGDAVELVREGVKVLLEEMSYKHTDCKCRQCVFIIKSKQWLKKQGE